MSAVTPKGRTLRRLTSASALAALVAVATSQSACEADASGAPAPIVRDSAGIRIIESAAPAWDSSSAWRLSNAPVLSIGQTSGEEPYLFYGIVGVERLSDGRIAVANYNPHEIRFFDATGRYLMRAGGQGDGPGEFQFMSLFWRLPGDTLVVSDIRDLTLMDRTGGYVRSVRLELPAGRRRSQPIAQLVDGTIVGAAASRGLSPSDAAGVIQDTTLFSRFSTDGSFVAELTSAPRAPIWGSEFAGAFRRREVPFTSFPPWGVSETHFYTSDGANAEIRVWRSDGSLDRILRWSEPDRPITSEMIARYRADLLESANSDDARRMNEAFLAEVQMPEQLPAVGELPILIDDEDNVWIERYQPPWERSTEWIVLSADGAWLGSVGMPPGFAPFDIRGGEVLGAFRDELGVEYVRAFAIERGTRPG